MSDLNLAPIDPHPGISLDQLADLPRWVAWQTQDNDKGKPTKVLYDPLPRKKGYAKATDPKTWGTRHQAEVRAAKLPKPYKLGGVGIVLGDLDNGQVLAGVDLDTCIDSDGRMTDWGAEVISRFDTYAEVSPSRTGAKLLFLTDRQTLKGFPELNENGTRSFTEPEKGDHPPAIELFGGARYFAITCDHIASTPVLVQKVSPEALKWLIEEAGPALQGRDKSEKQRRPHHTDPTANVDRSLAAWIMGFKAVSNGATYEEMKEVIRNDPATGVWFVEKGLANRERELIRIYQKAHNAAIRIESGMMKEIVDKVEQRLIDAAIGVYQRGPFIVRPGTVRIAVADGREVAGQRILEMGEHAVAEAFGSAARFERRNPKSRSWLPTDVPSKVVNTYRDRVGHWKLPVLAGVINAPTLRRDGSILSTPGYDPSTGLLFDPRGMEFPAIPEQPTRADALAALGLLKDLIKDFPFVSDADRSVALSCFLTAPIRHALRAAPMHAFTAPVAGSGKTKLVDIVSIIATGREAAVIAQGKTEEEFEKRLGSILLAGDPVIAIDNVEAPLGGQFLCMVLTQTIVRVRILGRSENPELPCAVLITATGNNLVIIGDATRRTLLGRLDPKMERPENREFDRDPVATAKAERELYLCAGLTILRAHYLAKKAGQVPPVASLGSFEEWSDRVRSALLWLGEADPVATMEVTRESDPQRAALIEVLEAWDRIIGTSEVTAKQLVKRANEAWEGGDATTLRDALLAVAGNTRGGDIDPQRLGKWLRANKDRIMNGRKICVMGKTDGAARWGVVSV